MPTLLKRLIWIAMGLSAVVAIAMAFRPQPIIVDTAMISRGALRVTVDDDGITRVRERYTVSAPVQGRLVRTPLDPGAVVEKGETMVAVFAPVPPTLLDARSLEQARANLKRAEAAIEEASARQKQAMANLTFTQSERARIENLVEQEIRKPEDLDRVMRDEQFAAEALRATEFAVQMARFGRDLAKASSLQITDLSEQNRQRENLTVEPRYDFELHSPVTGRVLRVFEESSRALIPGTPIFELGDLRTLEIVADYLSQDAVKVQPGMPVFVTGWGGEDLRGRVRLVEPSGFTKISALGVEEQRVNIVIDPDGDSDRWATIGDRFRVELRIELWTADEVVTVPTGAIFKSEGSEAVFIVVDGIAQIRPVSIGRRTGLQAQILSGLSVGGTVILYPSDLIEDGTRVQIR